MHLFDQIPTFAPDSILGLQKLFLEDARENKVNLIIGSYELPTKKYGGLSCIRKAQNVVLEEEVNKSYLPIQGHPGFLSEMRDLIFGGKYENRITDCQTLGGTGALHLGARLYSMAGLANKVYIPEQTWGNHVRIFSQENIEIIRYPYYDSKDKTLKIDLLVDSLKQIPNNSLILFHCCCHNPTGMDFSLSEWKALANLCKEKSCIPFLDAAYLGFAQGIEQDKNPIQIFLDNENTVFVSVSASKNFSLYGERVGYFAAYNQSENALQKIQACLQEQIRGEYSSAPRFGASIVSTILGNPYLKQEWLLELDGIRLSLNKMRERFVVAMRNSLGHSLDFLLKQNGFFGYPGFSAEQVEFLKKDKGVYTTTGGRFNLNGITDNNIGYVVQSFSEAIEKFSI